MAGADASIYSLIRPAPEIALERPEDIQLKRMQLKALMDDQGVKALQRREIEDSLGEKRSVREFLRGHTGPLEEAIPGITRISPEQGLKLQESVDKRRKSEAELLKTDRENFIALTNESHKALQTITTPEQWTAYRDGMAQSAGMFSTPAIRNAALRAVQQMPAQFDPEYIKRAVVKGEQLYTPKPERVTMPDGSIKTVDMNPFTNPQALNFQANPDMTPAEKDAKARGWRGLESQDWQVDTERGVRTNRRTGEVQQLTGAQIPPSPTKSREDADALRKEFEGKEAVKAYRDVVPISESARASPDTRAGDIQMAYAVGKILDPSSVVREGELKLVGNAATLPEKVQGEIRTLVMGKGRLTPETRRELQAMLDTAVGNRRAAYDAERKGYEGIVTRRGYKPEDVFIDTPKAAPSATPKPKTFDSLPDPKQFKDKKMQGDDGTIYKSDGTKWVRQ